MPTLGIMASSAPHGDSQLPPYLAGTLLLRGRLRFLFSAVLVGIYFIAGPIVLDALGYTTNVFIGPVVLLLAWMWGSTVGVSAALIGVMVNSYWAHAAGVTGYASGSRLLEAVVISTTAFVLGYIGRALERALGARARSDQAYTELELVARDRMLTITDQVPVGLYRTTPDGRIVGGNDALMNILGFADRSSMLRASVWDHYVDAKEREQQIRSKTSDLGSWREFQLRKEDGTEIWVRDWSRAVRNGPSIITHFDGVLEDITEQRVAAARFQAAFEDAPIGMAISTFDGRMIKGNAAVAELLGRPLEEISGIHFSEYSFDDDLPVTESALETLGAGQVVRYEKRLVRPDGSVIWALISLAPISESEGKARHFISHVVDVTDRRRAQEELENLIRSKDELIASVSHELRTPLTVVHGLAQELDTDWMAFSVSEQKEFISLIAQQSAEVAHIVEDLLVAARADIGKLPIHATTVDLLEQVERAARTVPDLDIAIEQIGDIPPVAHADDARVRQVVRNLLSNAQRYGGSIVVIRCGVGDRSAWIEVVDDGDGISMDEVPKVFEPYQRAHSAEGQPLSVGLGLTVSRKLAELMGGALTYRYSDERSIFRLELPLAGFVHGTKAAVDVVADA
jgi:PAS domain S-box-containing protein